MNSMTSLPWPFVGLHHHARAELFGQVVSSTRTSCIGAVVLGDLAPLGGESSFLHQPLGLAHR